MTTSVLAKNTVLKISISASLTVIPNLKSVSGIPQTGNRVDVTAITDPNAKTKLGIPTLGEYKFKLMHDPANAVHQYMKASAVAATGTDESFEHSYPNSGPNKETFTGPIADYNVGTVELQGVYMADVAIPINVNVSS